MFVDSHCHLDFPELESRLPEVLQAMRDAQVTHALSICVELGAFARVLAIAEAHPNVYASAGVHPDTEFGNDEPTVADLVRRAAHPKVVAIGETGLDYYRREGDLEWQRDRFRTHIRAARETGKPLVIHTRSAAADTLAIMRAERAHEAGGVMHCFTETLEVARAAIDLGFRISLSGIVTFRNAKELKDVAREVALEHLLIETDSPYLAPVPYRGRTNEPAYVRYVGEELARLKGISPEAVGRATSNNFFTLFRIDDAIR